MRDCCPITGELYSVRVFCFDLGTARGGYITATCRERRDLSVATHHMILLKRKIQRRIERVVRIKGQFVVAIEVDNAKERCKADLAWSAWARDDLAAKLAQMQP